MFLFNIHRCSHIYLRHEVCAVLFNSCLQQIDFCQYNNEYLFDNPYFSSRVNTETACCPPFQLQVEVINSVFLQFTSSHLLVNTVFCCLHNQIFSVFL